MDREFGAAILDAIRRKGWTQKELARKIPCKESMLSEWINGGRPISHHYVLRLVDLLDDVEFNFAAARWATGGQVGMLFGGIQGGRAGAAMRLDREMKDVRESIDAATDVLLSPANDVLRPSAMSAYMELMEAHVACAEVMRRLAGEYGFDARELHDEFQRRVQSKGYVVTHEIGRAA